MQGIIFAGGALSHHDGCLEAITTGLREDQTQIDFPETGVVTWILHAISDLPALELWATTAAEISASWIADGSDGITVRIEPV